MFPLFRSFVNYSIRNYLSLITVIISTRYYYRVTATIFALGISNLATLSRRFYAQLFSFSFRNFLKFRSPLSNCLKTLLEKTPLSSHPFLLYLISRDSPYYHFANQSCSYHVLIPTHFQLPIIIILLYLSRIFFFHMVFSLARSCTFL